MEQGAEALVALGTPKHQDSQLDSVTPLDDWGCCAGGFQGGSGDDHFEG